MHVETARECFHEGVQVAAEHYGCFCSQEPHPHCCLSRYSHQCPGSLGSGQPRCLQLLVGSRKLTELFSSSNISCSWNGSDATQELDRTELKLLFAYYISIPQFLALCNLPYTYHELSTEAFESFFKAFEDCFFSEE